ncbi:hypothetical protein GCM10011380_03710 [Sphingomonas metalli]|uniref:diguanylate cyclase n=1 Tax=Sphingomonas metalli TaxID=1779358 RepID=A0A916SUQ2_9SPHN|nr:hypothetical protein GCM10011380_03710 [Sphingomonas metalli]
MAACLALVLSAPAAASLGGPKLNVCIARAERGMAAPALFARPDRFDCAHDQRSFGSGDFWVLSQPIPPGRFDVIRMSSVFQDRVTLHILYADGTIRTLGFTSATTGRYLKMGAAIQLPIPRASTPPVRLLWHVEGAGNQRGIVLGPVVGTHRRDDQVELMLAGFYGVLIGGIAALLIYNLALVAALRQGFQISYCLLLGCIIGYALSTSGILTQIMPAIDNNSRLRLNWVLLGGSAAMVLVFARSFFERRVFAGWLGHAANGVIAALFLSSWTAALLSPWHAIALDRAMTCSFVALMLLVPAVLVRAWRVRSDYLWVFAIAWGAPIVFAGMRIAQAMGLIGWHFWLDQSTILSMAVEALLSGIGIAYRLRLLQHQRDEAREREMLARALADADPLTGLLNRRAFLHRAIGRQRPQLLVLADLDHFKVINETIGHDGGDEVLRSFARTLADAVPEDALVARIGGEEFAVVVDAATGLDVDALLHALRGARMPFDMMVTTSIGSCTGPLLRETDWKDLYRQADRALYAAKAAGRDRARDAASLSMAA